MRRLLPNVARVPEAFSRAALAAALLLALASAPTRSDEAESEVKPPGLPGAVDWTFNFDATLGAFGFSNSLYTNPKPDQPSGNLSDNWFEGSVKPALGGVYRLADSSQLFGKVSAVGERTYSAPPPQVGGEAASFGVEDLYLGWRSGDSLALGQDALELSVGRRQFQIGHGMLLWDGAAEGGSRGGYWTNARKAWKFAALGQLKTGSNTLQLFYLEKDELPEANNHSKVSGVNYEYAIGEDTTLGATYMHWTADQATAPQRDGLDVYDVRAFTAPIPGLKQLSFELEYAKENNGNALDSYAWNALVAYQFESRWQPKLSYRYAFFQGDNPGTTKNEGFDGLATGFNDWGMWWQGEIAGEYFLPNSNLISHQLRVHTTPAESLGTGLICYDFLLDIPAAFGPAVTSNKAAYELDWYADWAVNKHLNLTFVAAWAQPNKAVEQFSGRTQDFVYGMVFAAYSF
jgi:hypothetical protein